MLIGIGFYDYENAIAVAFRELGAEVRIEDEHPKELRGWIAGLYRRLSPDMVKAQARHLRAILRRAREDRMLDHVLVIKGTLLDESFLRSLRDAQPKARFTAYHWDSMARYPGLIERQKLFDRVLTFDHVDAASHPQFTFRPLFFRPELVPNLPRDKLKVDICFVGWLHHRRLAQVEAIQAQVAEFGMSASYYLSTGPATYVKLSLSGRGRYVHTRPMAFDDYVATVASSNVILDLPHPQQTGLTMRAIEAVGAGKKLITTARDVVHYDFYCPANVSIVDAEEPRLDLDFMSKPNEVVASEILKRYSLRSWVLDVCGLTDSVKFLHDYGPNA